MKISLNWLRTFIDIDLDQDALKDLLTDIGLEAESAEAYESLPGGLKGLVVAEVLTCEPHPDADKLKVTTIDAGTGEVLQVVCGAPNVAAGQKVVLAPVGARLYPQGQEPFEIKKARIRGVASNGMLCAEDEIGIGTSHDGIIVLLPDTPVGKPVCELYEVVNDVVFEIGLTPNRTDAQSHLGVARDLAAALSFRNRKEVVVRNDQAQLETGQSAGVEVVVADAEACPRYTGLVIEGLTVAPSPVWLQERLKAIGQKPVNNVVDVTNYILHSYGQPLHAFDLSAVKGNRIEVKTLPEGTVFKTLDNTDIKLHAEDLMICNAEDAMCIAGVYGGLKSGVKDSTTAIFLESAYFDPTSVRKTSMRHGLRTEAAQHFEKGVDPLTTVEVLKKAAALIIEVAGGKVTSSVTDILSADFEPHKVALDPGKVRKLTGAPISDEEIDLILQLLEIGIADKTDHIWTLEVPLYRADVTREVDVIEDILRIYGYNNVPIPSTINAAIPVRRGIDAEKLYRTAANFLCANGFYEMLNNSLTRSRKLEGLTPAEEQVKLLSSINAELDILRPCMQVSALDVLHYNINRSQKNLKLFEYGKTYLRKENGYDEQLHLFLAVTGEQLHANWTTAAAKADFYYLKGLVTNVLNRIGVQVTAVDDTTQALYDYSLILKSGNKEVAVIGKVGGALLKRWDIRQEVLAADLNWDAIAKVVSKAAVPKISIARFPSMRRDLALLLDKNVKFTEVQEIALRYGKKMLRQVDLFDVYEGDKIAQDKKSYAVSYVFRDDDKTLSDKEVDAIMGKLMEQYQKQLNAVVRGQS